MSALRQRLKHPGFWLLVLGVLALAALLDSFRAPQVQLSVPIYCGFLRVYRIVGHPLLEGKVGCRFQPTCSHYSESAVRRFGIRAGLVLTWKRLYRCRNDVGFGTLDPVPGA